LAFLLTYLIQTGFLADIWKLKKPIRVYMKPTTLDEAMALTKKFTERPSNEELLKLYGLYKQATEGDNTGERPGGFDFKAAAKYNSWLSLKGKSQEEATQEYIDFVGNLSEKYI
jgi:diazepam-binding inhibitor (GABA receptor modulating acyl-CoA-binding protein)